MDRLKENNGAVSVVLTPDDLAEIEAASQAVAIVGERYPEALKKMTGL
jgi:aryl-alcohol dehydrogenase-like predicted oxidoreductase